MQATITTCPFYRTEQLAAFADKGIEETESVIHERLENIKAVGLGYIASEIDDAFLKAINGAQTETIRGIVCSVCDQHAVCNAEQAC